MIIKYITNIGRRNESEIVYCEEAFVNVNVAEICKGVSCVTLQKVSNKTVWPLSNCDEKECVGDVSVLEENVIVL